MSDVADYDTDILLWSERQAALLRDLRASVRGLPNELDLENVAEEIETVGRSELRAAESYLSLIFVHLVKAASSTASEPVSHWLSEIRAFRRGFEGAVTASMFRRIDLNSLWRRAYRDTAADLSDKGEPVLLLPDECPFDLTELQSDDFAPIPAVERLRRLAGVEASA